MFAILTLQFNVGPQNNDGEIGEHNSNFTMVGDILSDTYNLKVS